MSACRACQSLPQQRSENYDQQTRLRQSCYGGHLVTPLCVEQCSHSRGTDISCCFVALGRKFQFPIDFLVDKHMELTSTPASVTSYSRDLANRLSASGKLRPSSLTNREHIIANSSTHVGPALSFTPSVTRFLLITQPDLTPREAKLISSFIPSQVHGSSLPNSTVPPTKLNMFRQRGRTRSCIGPLSLPCGIDCLSAS